MTEVDHVSETPNKAGDAYINLYHNDWRSSQTLQPTTASEFRGFMGDYNINIKKGGQTIETITFNLNQDTVIDCTLLDPLSNELICGIQE